MKCYTPRPFRVSAPTIFGSGASRCSCGRSTAQRGLASRHRPLFIGRQIRPRRTSASYRRSLRFSGTTWCRSRRTRLSGWYGSGSRMGQQAERHARCAWIRGRWRSGSEGRIVERRTSGDTNIGLAPPQADHSPDIILGQSGPEANVSSRRWRYIVESPHSRNL